MKKYIDFIKEEKEKQELSAVSYSLDKDKETSSTSNPSIVFTDVVKSSELWSNDPNTMKTQLDKHFKLVNDLAKKWNGFVVKTIGDAFMIYFEKSDDSLYNAINCSIEIIKNEELPLRVGACCGDMEEKSYTIQNASLRDFFGNAVNTASRMESKVAEPGGISFCHTDDISDKQSSNIKKLIDKLKFTKIEFSDSCEKDKEELQGKRSGRLLSDVQVHRCMDIQQLKGVKEVDVFKFKVK